jgi:hypothetical protein
MASALVAASKCQNRSDVGGEIPLFWRLKDGAGLGESRLGKGDTYSEG